MEIKQKYGLKWVEAIEVAESLRKLPQRLEDRLARFESEVRGLRGEVQDLPEPLGRVVVAVFEIYAPGPRSIKEIKGDLLHQSK